MLLSITSINPVHTLLKTYGTTITVFPDAVDGAEAVFHADFFASFVATWVVGDRDFVDFDSYLRYLGGNLWFEAKTVFFDIDGLNDFTLKGLVASLHTS